MWCAKLGLHNLSVRLKTKESPCLMQIGCDSQLVIYPRRACKFLAVQRDNGAARKKRARDRSKIAKIRGTLFMLFALCSFYYSERAERAMREWANTPAPHFLCPFLPPHTHRRGVRAPRGKFTWTRTKSWEREIRGKHLQWMRSERILMRCDDVVCDTGLWCMRKLAIM